MRTLFACVIVNGVKVMTFSVTYSGFFFSFLFLMLLMKMKNIDLERVIIVVLQSDMSIGILK